MDWSWVRDHLRVAASSSPATPCGPERSRLPGAGQDSGPSRSPAGLGSPARRARKHAATTAGEALARRSASQASGRRSARARPPQGSPVGEGASTPGAGYRPFPGPAGGLKRGPPPCRPRREPGAGTASCRSRRAAGRRRGRSRGRPVRSPVGLGSPAKAGQGGHAGAVPRRLRRPPCCDGRRAVRPPRESGPAAAFG